MKEYLIRFSLRVLVFLFVMFTVGTMVDTNQKVTKIYETVVLQDTTVNKTNALLYDERK